MKRYKLPLLLFLAYVLSFLLKKNFYDVGIFRVFDFISFMLLPFSIISLFFKLKQTKDTLLFIVSSLIIYFLIDIAIHLDFLKRIFTESWDSRLESLFLLKSLTSFVFYFWVIAQLSFVISIVLLMVKYGKLEKEDFIKNKLVLVSILLALLVYFMDYGFFDIHGGWTGYHGHAFWESSGHLH